MSNRFTKQAVQPHQQHIYETNSSRPIKQSKRVRTRDL
jgi:hypothetical protein